jgi:hypothetical protein
MDQEFAGSGVTVALEQAAYANIRESRMPEDLSSPVLNKLGYLRMLSEIRWGNVPIIRTDIHVDSDEYAHFAIPATYFKPNKTIKVIPGRLLVRTRNAILSQIVGLTMLPLTGTT